MTTILIADDISDNRYLLTAIFQGSGYEVVAAENGAEALERALQSPPDLIVTDILMPVMDGFELCRRWKEDERLKTIPFIFYTATYVSSKDEVFALSLGAERFVVKPQKPEALVQIVREVLDETRRRQPSIPGRPLGDDMEVLRDYNAVLFRKLERKVFQLQCEVAERQRAQAALQETQEQLLQAHQLAHIGVWSWDADTDTSLFSQELCQIAGLDPTAPVPAYAEHAKAFTPESWHRVDTAVHRALQTGEPYQLELELCRPDGSRRWIEAYGGAKRDGAGRITGVHGTVHDVTERKQSEEKLRWSNLLLVTQMEVSIDGVLVVNEEMRIVLRNRRFVEMWGLAPEEVASDSDGPVLKSVIAQQKNPRAFLEKVHRLYESRTETSQDELELIDGRTFDRYSAPMVGQDGAYFGRVWLFRDITERKKGEQARKKLEEQLRMSQKMEAIGSLAGGVAHDFNNLLSVILNYTDFAIEAVEGQANVDLREVRKAAQRAAVLTRQLLAFGRKQELKPETLDLNQTAAGIEKMLARLIGENINLLLVLSPDLGLTLADPGQVEQVIMNLAINARDAMPDGGMLAIETANIALDEEYAAAHADVIAGPYVMLSVTDSGCGMDDQTQARIFEPFFTTKEKGKGTGLGLATVYGIVMQSGGHIWVYSEPGKGTTFKVFFPRAPDAVSSAAKPPVAPSRSRGTETILVVEDEEALRRVAERILRAAGYRVLTAANGEDALATCEKHEGAIHLLMTDVVLPQMNGRVLADRLVVARPGLRVLFVSGYTDNALARTGVLGPGTDFISKPFSAVDLTRLVRDVLDREVAAR